MTNRLWWYINRWLIDYDGKLGKAYKFIHQLKYILKLWKPCTNRNLS